MNCFEYAESKLFPSESFVCGDKHIKLYDGDLKTNYENGDLMLTSHRLCWGRPGELELGKIALCLYLKYVKSIEEEVAGSFFTGKKTRLIINLLTLPNNKRPGPQDFSLSTYIKLSGPTGIDLSFIESFRSTLSARIWEVVTEDDSDDIIIDEHRRIKLRTGIVGIERSLLERHKQTGDNIQMAFQDLNKLMSMAKDMVVISKSISAKIRERNGDISEDETVRFKTYLMSMGIDDPVTRESFESSSKYYASLSQQVCEVLLDPVVECGGMMSLADAYCRINRARGLELLSPEDLLNACKQLSGPVKLRKFPSGAMVLQLESHDDETVARDTGKQVEKEKSLTAEELARILSISILLAQERLLTAERAGNICRDESIEGLRFYPNKFLNKI